jgi:hypothetical protein
MVTKLSHIQNHITKGITALFHAQKTENHSYLPLNVLYTPYRMAKRDNSACLRDAETGTPEANPPELGIKTACRQAFFVSSPMTGAFMQNLDAG